jgi:hypothetical protein
MTLLLGYRFIKLGDMYAMNDSNQHIHHNHRLNDKFDLKQNNLKVNSRGLPKDANNLLIINKFDPLEENKNPNNEIDLNNNKNMNENNFNGYNRLKLNKQTIENNLKDDSQMQGQGLNNPNLINNNIDDSANVKNQQQVFANRLNKQRLDFNSVNGINAENSINAANKFQLDANINKTLSKLERFVHIDLKGAPPKPDYFKKFIPLLREHGATGILLEYEDMFPYEGVLAEARHGNAYSKADIAMLKEIAKLNNLAIMPLVQTYG